VSQLRLEDGEIVGPDGTREPLASILNRMPAGVLEVDGAWVPPGMAVQQLEMADQGGVPIAGPSYPAFSAAAFGAQFVEVRINPRTRTIRAPRMVGVFAAGRILNAKTAHSQLMGGMVWGLSNALLEETEIDRKRARFVNANIAEYHIAVNADVVSVEVEMLDEKDELVNPLGVKGIGELGIVGTSAAIANAVYHATGIRVRKTPILIEDILPQD
jgi:xanthine dehydrogenase YagR molybdenum-binding subunit